MLLKLISAAKCIPKLIKINNLSKALSSGFYEASCRTVNAILKRGMMQCITIIWTDIDV